MAAPVPFTEVPEWVPLVQTKLKTVFEEADLPRLNALLQECGAVIAGGFVLRSIDRPDLWALNKSDIDFYVPAKNAKKFIDGMLNTAPALFKPVRGYYNNSTTYCSSFLRRNGIRRVYTFININNSIDIMSVRNSRSIESVVSNFDLTFCQVMYDGVKVMATHPDHIRTRSGQIKTDYLKLLISGNSFLRNRIKKYVEFREFKVSAEGGAFGPGEVVRLFEEKCNKDVDEDDRRNDIFEKNAARGLLFFSLNMIKCLPMENKYILKTTQSAFYETSIYGNKAMRTDITWGVDDDGYDSEDYDRGDLALQTYKPPVAPHTELAPPSAETKDLHAGRVGTRLFIESFCDCEPETNRYGFKKNINYKSVLDYDYEKYTTFRIGLMTKLLRTGNDPVTYEDTIVYDLHEHSEADAISQASLQTYLYGYKGYPNKDRVPCFAAPACKHLLDLRTISALVSREFYEEYKKPAPIKSGLNQSVNFYDKVLYNSKSNDPRGFGNIFHDTVCPFCLQFESRTEGCIYMVHDNPERLYDTKTPFCQKEFVIESLRAAYHALGQSLVPAYAAHIPGHLEFCAECGRPCFNHRHFDLNDPPNLIPTTGAGKCDGGGRRELIARILAIREEYAKPGKRKPADERRAAALAAQAAAKNPAYLARADAILAVEGDARRWNTAVPKPSEKNYNDPAYAPAAGAGAAGAGAAVRRRRNTIKRRKVRKNKSRRA